MERLKHMKESLMSCVQGQLGDLTSVDAKELGEAVDMIKDLSEAIYYCTIVKSMEDTEKEGKEKYYPVMYYPTDYNRYYPTEYRDMDRGMGRMYYDGGNTSSNGNSSSRGYQDGNRQTPGESRNYSGREYPVEIRDYREGQSPLTRKTYMERKMHGGDKSSQMQQLEKYMHELSEDLSEMIQGSSPEEKQLLQKKLTTLANKIV